MRHGWSHGDRERTRAVEGWAFDVLSTTTSDPIRPGDGIAHTVPSRLMSDSSNPGKSWDETASKSGGHPRLGMLTKPFPATATTTGNG